MKCVALMGSPRKTGNSSTLAHEFIDVVKASGADVQIFRLNETNIKGCQACRTCRTQTDYCAIGDDLSVALEAVKNADVVLFASPVYFGDISSQLKSFFDRTYSYFNDDFTCRLAPGKQSVFILTQAQADEKLFDDIHPRYERWLMRYGFTNNRLIRATGVRDIGDIRQKPEAVERARNMARQLVSGVS